MEGLGRFWPAGAICISFAKSIPASRRFCEGSLVGRPDCRAWHGGSQTAREHERGSVQASHQGKRGRREEEEGASGMRSPNLASPEPIAAPYREPSDLDTLPCPPLQEAIARIKKWVESRIPDKHIKDRTCVVDVSEVRAPVPAFICAPCG